MRDIDIRQVLMHDVRRRHLNEPDTLIVQELGLCQGLARVDLAVINGSVHGYEIKSEHDTLFRLPSQTETYSRVLDFVTIVTAPIHVKNLREIVPQWWGISTAALKRGHLQIESKRKPRANPSIDSFALAQLLWREEALSVLTERGIAAGIKNKPRDEMWRSLATHLTLDELRAVVRKHLKFRPNWRVLSPLVLNGD